MARGKIACKKCNNCGPDAKKKYDGRGVEIKGKVPGHPDLVDVKPDGDDVKGDVRWCPTHNVLPGDAPVVDTTAKPEPPPTPPAPPKPKAKYVDFGYGPACEHCRATKGECHGLGCPHYEEGSENKV